ncbi:MAG: creatininase family protein [Pirellulales bacterium]
MTKPAEILLRKHTRREFRQRMQAGELKCCIIPVAAIEQHLEHLAMEHDWRSVCHIAELVAARLRPQVVVAEGLMAGISEHHMKHPGTLTLLPGSFLAVLNDLIDSMVRAGFKNIIVLNGHGGNVRPCDGIWDQFLRKYQINLHFFPYWNVLTAEDAKLLESGQRMPYDMPGHAQEWETSFALAAFPENVRTDMWKDQEDQKPSLATAEKGRIYIERIVDRLAVYLQEMIDGQRTIEIPPFHP